MVDGKPFTSPKWWVGFKLFVGLVITYIYLHSSVCVIVVMENANKLFLVFRVLHFREKFKTKLCLEYASICIIF